VFSEIPFASCVDQVFSLACSPTDATLVATGGRDARGFLWKIGQGNRASELQGIFTIHNLLMN
jgi:angio-associated migratory cell protein